MKKTFFLIIVLLCSGLFAREKKVFQSNKEEVSAILVCLKGLIEQEFFQDEGNIELLSTSYLEGNKIVAKLVINLNSGEEKGKDQMVELLMVGEVNECFVITVKFLESDGDSGYASKIIMIDNYIDEDYDGFLDSSLGHKKRQIVYRKIIDTLALYLGVAI